MNPKEKGYIVCLLRRPDLQGCTTRGKLLLANISGKHTHTQTHTHDTFLSHMSSTGVHRDAPIRKLRKQARTVVVGRSSCGSELEAEELEEVKLRRFAPEKFVSSGFLKNIFATIVRRGPESCLCIEGRQKCVSQ